MGGKLEKDMARMKNQREMSRRFLLLHVPEIFQVLTQMAGASSVFSVSSVSFLLTLMVPLSL